MCAPFTSPRQAPLLGFEPSLTVLETVVLPLHYRDKGEYGIRTHARYKAPNKVATCPLKPLE